MTFKVTPFIPSHVFNPTKQITFHRTFGISPKQPLNKHKLTRILLRSFSDKNFTGGYFWVKLQNISKQKKKH